MDSPVCMIRSGFLDKASRKDLVALARDGSAAHRLARRANSLVLLDQGMSCAAVARVLLLDDDTIRAWYLLYQEDGIEGIATFGHEGRACRLNDAQQAGLTAWVSATLPHSTRQIGAWIERHYGVRYETRSGLIALLHRLGLEHRRPKPLACKLDAKKQEAFIKAYENQLNHLGADEVVLFGDAVHPVHAAKPVGCWAPKHIPLAIAQTSGRQGLNIHGALNLETGETHMIEALSVDADSTIRLLTLLEARYPHKRVIHFTVDNARYHHAKKVKQWLAQPGRRIRLRFVPAYCPHLNPIERLWGVMHRHVTHNRCHANFNAFVAEILTFLREEVPRRWQEFRDQVTDNFRVIRPQEFRVIR